MNVCVCKEGWFVALGQEKRIACMWGKLGQGMGCLKGGGGVGTALRAMMWKFYCDGPIKSY